MFGRRNNAPEVVVPVEVPSPNEVFRGSLRVSANLDKAHGLPGLLRVQDSSYFGSRDGELVDYAPGMDLQRMDLINSVAERRILVPSQKRKSDIRTLWVVANLPERTVNTETNTTIFDLGRFCLDGIKKITKDMSTDVHQIVALDHEFTEIPEYRVKPSKEVELLKMSKKRLKPVMKNAERSVESENPQTAALERVKKAASADDAIIVFSDFIDTDTEATANLLTGISRRVNGRLWSIRPRSSSQDGVVPTGSTTLTTAQRILLDAQIAESVDGREQGIEQTGLVQHEVLMDEPNGESVYRQLARILLKG